MCGQVGVYTDVTHQVWRGQSLMGAGWSVYMSSIKCGVGDIFLLLFSTQWKNAPLVCGKVCLDLRKTDK